MNTYLLINSNKFTKLKYTSNERGSKKHNILTFKNNFIQSEEVLLEEKFYEYQIFFVTFYYVMMYLVLRRGF